VTAAPPNLEAAQPSVIREDRNNARGKKIDF